MTGHHARIRHDANGFHLMRAVDRDKDQSYVLHMLGQDELSQVQFPVGEMTKTDVRDHATRLGLRTAMKPDSQDICFVSGGNYRGFLQEYYPDTAAPGVMTDTAGAVVGSHDGAVNFTIGQRRGLGVAVGQRRYVVDIQPQTNTIVIGRKSDLLVSACEVREMSYVSGAIPECDVVDVQLRYRSTTVPSRLEGIEPGRVVLRFREAQTGVVPGQSAVIYEGDDVLGGGIISGVFDG